MIQVAFDVGGTFTDFVLQGPDGKLHTSKRLTTYPDPTEACLAGLDDLVAGAGLSWRELERAVHGTTLGSNLVIERKATGVALVTTRGFRDVLGIGRQKRYQLYDLHIRRPEPLIPRSLCFEVTERMLAGGEVRTPLDETEAVRLIGYLRRIGIRSLAVCFLHSYANPDHEIRFRELCQALAPGIRLSLSSEVSPQFREYERTSTTVVNAYLMEAVGEYLGRMESQLRQRGYGGRLFIMQSGGGAATASAMSRFPVRMIESGPAAGALVAAMYGRLAGRPDLIAFDMGGTTAKLSLIRDGRPDFVDTFELHRVRLAPGSGIPMTVRSLDLVEIGAGGGSIARPQLGTIAVGPDSAGSSPGPVCYGRGGTAPTVTDANLVLGYLSPLRFAGGSLQLDLEAARAAIRRQVADPLGLSVEQAAWGIHALVNLNMELATRVVSIERGHDPRELALVATGGSGPAHACRLAAALGVPVTVIPAAAGVASAVGLLSAEVRFDLSHTQLHRLDQIDPQAIARVFDAMAATASDVIRQSTGAPPVRLEVEVDLRYAGQGYELTIALPSRHLDPAGVDELRRRFEAAYAARYGAASPEEAVEATTWRLAAIGRTPGVELPRYPAREDGAPPPIVEKRPVYFPETGGYTDTAVYDRDLLFAGAALTGPAVIHEHESTTVLPPGMNAVVDEYGSLLVTTA